MRSHSVEEMNSKHTVVCVWQLYNYFLRVDLLPSPVVFQGRTVLIRTTKVWRLLSSSNRGNKNRTQVARHNLMVSSILT